MLDDAATFLHALSTQSVSIARGLIQRRRKKSRSPKKNGWSPAFLAIKAALTFLIDIRRHLCGQHGRRRWLSSASAKRGIARLYDIWHATVDSLKLTDTKRKLYTTINGRDTTSWATITWEQLSLRQIQEDIKAMRKLAHGRARTELRKRLNNHVAFREEKRGEGKTGYVIRSILDSHKQGFCMDVLHDPATDDITTDPIRIYELATKHFEEWFGDPSGTENDAIHNEKDAWMRSLATFDEFQAHIGHLGIPESIAKLLFKAITTVPNYELARLEMELILTIPPTLTEFSTAIKHLKTNKAGGWTGLTFNMIRKWSDTAIAAAHEALCILWKRKDIPHWWKWRLLTPIPKKAESTDLANFRPLMLIETTRKLWTSILIKKVSAIWHKHKLLSTAQNAFIWQLGTDSASIQHVQVLEEAQRLGCSIHRSSWDMSRAFDAVSKNAARLAWTRLGIPMEIADYLVSQDVQGTNVVNCPLSMATEKEFGYSGFKGQHPLPSYLKSEVAPKDSLPTFPAARGTGQGDVTSPACWTAVFDILLRALQLDGTGAFFKRSHNGDVTLVMDNAFADDMDSKTATIEGLQRKADIVSAFCVLFNINISIPKLRRVSSHWQQKKGDAAENIIIHTRGWQAQEVEGTSKEATEYLGVKYDTDNSGSTALREMLSMASKVCNIIRHTTASVESKMLVAIMSTYAKIKYQAKMCGLTLQEYQELDKPFHKLFTEITKNLHGYPKELLHSPTLYGGLGVPRLSDLIQEDKLGMLYRTLHGSPQLEDTAISLLQNLALDCGQDWTHDKGGVLTELKHTRKHYWLRSTAEWLAQAGVYVCRAATPQVDEGEITYLERNQFWKANAINGLNGQTKTIYEILAWRARTDGQLDLNVQEWRSRWDVTSKCTHYLPVHQLQGAATQAWFPYSTIFPNQTAVRTTLLKKQLRQKTLYISNTATESPVPTTRKARENPVLLQHVDTIRATFAAHLQSLAFYTDGSWTQLRSPSTAIFKPEDQRVQGSAGLVILVDSPDWRQLPSYAIHINDGQLIGATSAYTMELLAISLALRLQELLGVKASLHSDSSASIKYIKGGIGVLRCARSTHRLLVQSASTSVKSIGSEPLWVRGHPERRKKDNDTWTPAEWGNHLADRAADADWQSLYHQLSAMREPERWSATVCTKYLLRPGQYYWGYADGAPVAVDTITTLLHKEQWRRYLEKRNTAQPWRPAGKWLDNTLVMAATIYSISKTPMAKRAAAVRIIYDKGWHGGNRIKEGYYKRQNNTLTALQECYTCGQPDSQEHWICYCPHPSYDSIRVAAIQAVRAQYSTEEPSSRLYRMGEYITTYAGRAEGHRIWTANWTTPLMVHFLNYIGIELTATPQQVTDIRKQLYKLLTPLTRATQELWQVKCQREKDRRDTVHMNKQTAAETPSETLPPPITSSVVNHLPPISDGMPLLTESTPLVPHVSPSGSTVAPVPFQATVPMVAPSHRTSQVTTPVPRDNSANPFPITAISHDGTMQVTLKMKGTGRERYLNNQIFNDQLYDLNSLTDFLMTSPIIKYEVSIVDRRELFNSCEGDGTCMVRAELMASKRGQLQRDDPRRDSVVDLNYTDNADRDEMIQWLQRTQQLLPRDRDPMPQCLHDSIAISEVKLPHLIDWLRTYDGRPYPAEHWYSTFQHITISDQHSPSSLWVHLPSRDQNVYTLQSYTLLPEVESAIDFSVTQIREVLNNNNFIGQSHSHFFLLKTQFHHQRNFSDAVIAAAHAIFIKLAHVSRLPFSSNQFPFLQHCSRANRDSYGSALACQHHTQDRYPPAATSTANRLNLDIIDVPSDRYSLYHAIRYMLINLHVWTSTSAPSVFGMRNNCVQWLLRETTPHLNTPSNISLQSLCVTTETSWSMYCDIIQESILPPDNVFLWALCHLYNISLHVYNIVSESNSFTQTIFNTPNNWPDRDLQHPLLSLTLFTIDSISYLATSSRINSNQISETTNTTITTTTSTISTQKRAASTTFDSISSNPPLKRSKLNFASRRNNSIKANKAAQQLISKTPATVAKNKKQKTHFHEQQLQVQLISKFKIQNSLCNANISTDLTNISDGAHSFDNPRVSSTHGPHKHEQNQNTNTTQQNQNEQNKHEQTIYELSQTEPQTDGIG